MKPRLADETIHRANLEEPKEWAALSTLTNTTASDT